MKTPNLISKRLQYLLLHSRVRESENLRRDSNLLLTANLIKKVESYVSPKWH